MYFYDNQRRWPGPGTVISVPAYILFRHEGVVSDRWHYGKPMVISNSARAGGIAEEPWDVFTSGQPWSDEGQPGNLSPWEVLHRARSARRTQYNVLDWNCENFVAYCHGLAPSSPQVAAVTLITIVGIALAATRS